MSIVKNVWASGNSCPKCSRWHHVVKELPKAGPPNIPLWTGIGLQPFGNQATQVMIEAAKLHLCMCGVRLHA